MLAEPGTMSPKALRVNMRLACAEAEIACKQHEPCVTQLRLCCAPKCVSDELPCVPMLRL